ncbi:MAG: acyl-CoA dehydrogenase family protein, partial [Candidatus Zixiibacteriota bacterium]
MSSFCLTEEQLEFAAMAREFCQKRVFPATRELDEEGMSDEFVGELASLGYLGASIPAEYGGMGLDPVSVACLIEEFAKANGGVATLIAAHLSLGCKTLEVFGNDAQKKKYLPDMAR